MVLNQLVLIFFLLSLNTQHAFNMSWIVDRIRAWHLCSATELIFRVARLLANIPWIAWIQQRKTLADRDIENDDGIVERSEVSVN
jgi:hypothetical protein